MVTSLSTSTGQDRRQHHRYYGKRSVKLRACVHGALQRMQRIQIRMRILLTPTANGLEHTVRARGCGGGVGLAWVLDAVCAGC